MDNTLVSARVPVAKKERANSVLASIGATASDLINSAYDYVIAEKKLPTVAEHGDRTTEGFQAFVASSTLAVDWPADSDGDYKSFLKEQRLARYESLA